MSYGVWKKEGKFLTTPGILAVVLLKNLRFPLPQMGEHKTMLQEFANVSSYFTIRQFSHEAGYSHTTYGKISYNRSDISKEAYPIA